MCEDLDFLAFVHRLGEIPGLHAVRDTMPRNVVYVRYRCTATAPCRVESTTNSIRNRCKIETAGREVNLRYSHARG